MHEIVSIESADKATPAAALAARITALFSKLFYLIPIGIIGNILYSLLSADPAMMRSVVQFSPVYLVLALLLSVVPWFTGSLRLFIWARFLGKCGAHIGNMFKIVISAELGAAVSPPIVAGGPVKVWMLMQQGFSGSKALSLTVLEGFEDAVFFVVLVPVALTVSQAWNLPVIKNALGGFAHQSFWIFLGLTSFFLCAGLHLVRHHSSAIRTGFHC